MTQKICSIICGAPDAALDPAQVEGLVIAADSGLDHALCAGIVPDIAVGDFDSARCEVPSGVECIRVPPEKDDTDTILAAETAIKRGCGRLKFFCAIGGRTDHTIANLQMLYGLLDKGVSAEIIGDGERLYLLRNGTARIAGFEGYLSVFAFGGNAVASESGVKYPVDKAELSCGYPLGVSNEVTGDFAEITAHSGTLLVVEHYGR